MSKDNQAPRRGGPISAILLGLAALIAGLTLHAARTGTGQQVDAASVEAGHELRDASFGRMVFIIVLLLIGIGLVVALATGFQTLITGRMGLFDLADNGIADQPNVPAPPAPRLETVNGQVLAELRVKEDALLQGYGWIDKEAGVVRIPIDRAIELLAERGLPTRAEGPAQGAPKRPERASSGRTQEETAP